MDILFSILQNEVLQVLGKLTLVFVIVTYILLTAPIVFLEIIDWLEQDRHQKSVNVDDLIVEQPHYFVPIELGENYKIAYLNEEHDLYRIAVLDTQAEKTVQILYRARMKKRTARHIAIRYAENYGIDVIEL